MKDGIEIRKVDFRSYWNDDEVRIEVASGLPHRGCARSNANSFTRFQPYGDAMERPGLLFQLGGGRRHSTHVVNRGPYGFPEGGFFQYNRSGDFRRSEARREQTC